MLALARAAAAEPMRGFWLAPEWIFPDGRPPPTEIVARSAVAEVLDRLAAMRVNTLFMESFLRGYGIAPFAGPDGMGLPVYPLCRLPEGSPDLMRIVIDEARRRGMDVHAWVHVFYFRTDNPALAHAGQGGQSVFGDLIAGELDEAAARASGAERTMLEAAAREATRELDLERLSRIVAESPNSTVGGPINAVYRAAARAGLPSRLFLRTTGGDIHPSVGEDRWMALYFDPANASVQERLLWVVERVSHAYPDLRGVHLDHIRYPRGPLGLPAALARLRPPMVFPGGLRGTLYKEWRAHQRLREETLRRFVVRVGQVLAPGQVLSAAVHPLYYHERDDWSDRLTVEDFVAQDWYRWGLDLVVPMIYDSDAARIGRVLRRYRFDLGSHEAQARRVRIVPGTNVFGLLTGPRSLFEWVYFDFDQFQSLRAGSSPPARVREEAGDGDAGGDDEAPP
jgi:uncharacterized lipoprotein YddW (UPF0748 family)